MEGENLFFFFSFLRTRIVREMKSNQDLLKPQYIILVVVESLLQALYIFFVWGVEEEVGCYTKCCWASSFHLLASSRLLYPIYECVTSSPATKTLYRLHTLCIWESANTNGPSSEPSRQKKKKNLRCNQTRSQHTQGKKNGGPRNIPRCFSSLFVCVTFL